MAWLESEKHSGLYTVRADTYRKPHCYQELYSNTLGIASAFSDWESKEAAKILCALHCSQLPFTTFC